MVDTTTNEKAQIVQALLDVAEVAQTTIDSTLQDFDAPASAATTLRILATSTEPLTPRDLARRLERDPSTASLVADKLEQAGILTRQPHPSDGRKRVLVLTARGELLWSTLRERLHDSALFSSLDSAECHELLELLHKMRAR